MSELSIVKSSVADSPNSSLPEDLLVRGSGAVARETARHSHFLDPLSEKDTYARGNSRRWGDAPLAVQREAVTAIREESGDAKFNQAETAFALAVARTESGFNPDAAAQSTSATGLGQLIDATGEHYGVNEENRFDLRANARAMVSHLRDTFDYVGRRFRGVTQEKRFTLTYGVYHDGPRLDHGGEKIAKERVLPWVEQYQKWLQKSE